MILFFGWAFTFSAAGLLFLTVSVVASYTLLGKVKSLINLKSFFVLFIIIISLSAFIEIDFSFFDKIIGKITFASDGGTSSNQRTDIFITALSRFIDNPFFGYGLGYTSSLNEMSPVNWYMVILTNGGLVSFIPLCLFIFFKFLKARKLALNSSPLYLVGFLCAIFGFVGISTFYLPFFWILLTFIEVKTIYYKNYDKNLSSIQ